MEEAVDGRHSSEEFHVKDDLLDTHQNISPRRNSMVTSIFHGRPSKPTGNFTASPPKRNTSGSARGAVRRGRSSALPNSIPSEQGIRRDDNSIETAELLSIDEICTFKEKVPMSRFLSHEEASKAIDLTAHRKTQRIRPDTMGVFRSVSSHKSHKATDDYTADTDNLAISAAHTEYEIAALLIDEKLHESRLNTAKAMSNWSTNATKSSVRACHADLMDQHKKLSQQLLDSATNDLLYKESSKLSVYGSRVNEIAKDFFNSLGKVNKVESTSGSENQTEHIHTSKDDSLSDSTTLTRKA